MVSDKLFNKNFSLVLIGQIISLFGNTIIRLVLPLYLLDLTGSASLYGIASACSMIPMIILSPIGGILADRVSKRNIMVGLDFATAALLLIFSVATKVINPVATIMVTMMILFGIQALYQPSVQASIPFLETDKNLLKANSLINQVNAISSILGPIIGGVLYGLYGIWPVVLISSGCFAISAIMEIFIVIPFKKQASKEKIWQIVKGDFLEGLHFIAKEKRVLLKIGLVCAAINLVLSAMLIVGLPTILRIHLAVSDEMYSFAQGSLGIGSLLGGLSVTLLGNKIKVDKLYLLLIGASISLLPIAASLCLGMTPMVAYVIILVCCMIGLAMTTAFSIVALTYIQKETPSHLIGKVMACISMICMCASPLGQAIYGVLFEQFDRAPGIIFCVGLLVALGISILSKGAFRALKQTEIIANVSV